MILGIPMGLQFSITAIGTIIVQSAVNIYGATYMAGFSAAGKIQNVIGMVAVSMGATIATYVGQNRGAGRMDRVKQGVKYSWIMLLVWSVVEMALVYFGGKYFTYSVYQPVTDRCCAGVCDIFRTVFWAYPFLCTIFVFRNALQGMGYGIGTNAGSVFELVCQNTDRGFGCGKNDVCRRLPGGSNGLDRSTDSTDSILLLCNGKTYESNETIGVIKANFNPKRES